MLTRKTPDTISASLTVTGQGEEPITFNVTYHNLRSKDFNAAIAEKSLAQAILLIVKDWEAEYPLTPEGVEEMEEDRPFILLAIVQGYHDARRVKLAGN